MKNKVQLPIAVVLVCCSTLEVSQEVVDRLNGYRTNLELDTLSFFLATRDSGEPAVYCEVKVWGFMTDGSQSDEAVAAEELATFLTSLVLRS